MGCTATSHGGLQKVDAVEVAIVEGTRRPDPARGSYHSSVDPELTATGES